MTAALSIYFVLLLLLDSAGIRLWRHLSYADKCLAVLAWLTTADELTAFLVQLWRGNSMVIYHLYSPLELLLLSLYFNESVASLRKYRVGYMVGAAGILAAAINARWFQPVTTMNANFLLLEGTAVVVCCLLSLQQLVLDEDRPLLRQAQFWITCLLLVYWSLTFTGWGIFMFIETQGTALHALFYKVLSGANYLLYGGLALVFLVYKKLVPSGNQ